MSLKTATLDEIKDAGKWRGIRCTEHQTLPDVGSRVLAPEGMYRSGSIVLQNDDEVEQYVTACAYDSEEHDRSYSPFEFTASALNSRDDSEAAWEAYQEGIDVGIEETVKARLATKKVSQ